MQQSGTSLDEELVFYQELTHENAWEVCRKIFNRSNPPDGIFTANDTSALAVLLYAKDNVVSSPVDTKIFGYTDVPLSAIVEPALLLIVHNISSMDDTVTFRM